MLGGAGSFTQHYVRQLINSSADGAGKLGPRSLPGAPSYASCSENVQELHSVMGWAMTIFPIWVEGGQSSRSSKTFLRT